MKLTPQTFLISDTHFYHSNLWKIWGRPEDSDERIIRNWNQVISKKDKVLHLGDIIFSNKEKAMDILNKLNGEKYLIRGNHDDSSETWYKDCGFITVESIFKRFKDKYDNWIKVLFTHEPVFDLPKGWFNIHGHMHNDTHRGKMSNAEYYYDVGVDGNDFTPVPLYQILSEFFKLATKIDS